MSEVAWGDVPYDSKTPAEVVHDYAVVRGDLCDQYARDQLADWIKRYGREKAREALEAAADALFTINNPPPMKRWRDYLWYASPTQALEGERFAQWLRSRARRLYATRSAGGVA